MRQISILLFSSLLFICSCANKPAKDDNNVVEVQTPVTVTTVKKVPLVDYTELNATAQYLEKNYVKANINGYVETVPINIGQEINPGQLLFVLKTKEAKAIGNAVNKLNKDFHFSGVNNIKANKHGFITAINHQQGDYVQDGEQLAVINDRKSFAFVMDTPFELIEYLKQQKFVDIRLPDNTVLQGNIERVMPTVDSISQTQRVVLKVNTNRIIPENLIAKVRIIKADHSDNFSLPKEAILTNDIQSEYWVMKMIDSVTAVKTIITKGIESENRIEILSPTFSAYDLILVSGNYGLADTAKVKIISKQ